MLANFCGEVNSQLAKLRKEVALRIATEQFVAHSSKNALILVLAYWGLTGIPGYGI